MKRSRIQRKVGLKRTEFKRTPGSGLKPGGYLKRKPSKNGRMSTLAPRANRTEQRRQARELFEDSHGVRLNEVRLILGEDKSRWQAVRRVTRPTVLTMFHRLHDTCWVSGERGIEAHHMASGFTRGKSDELCALAALSPKWHGVVNTDALPLGRLLYLKWKHDRDNCDWVRLTLLFGYFLPDFQVKG